MSFPVRVPAALAALFLAMAPPAPADWTATGRFLYSDRLYGMFGFEETVPKPAREADVQIFDAMTMQTLASGATDRDGFFSIEVADSQARTVGARVIASTLQTATLNIVVVDDSVPGSPVHSWRDFAADIAGHAPDADADFGEMLMPPTIGNPAAVDPASQAFNVFDMGLAATDFIAGLNNGTRPTVGFSVGWSANSGRGSTFYNAASNRVFLADDDGYDDPNILHELGHYAEDEFGASSNPGGSHFVTDNDQDLRLAWSEGFATFFANAVLLGMGAPRPDLYSDRNSFSEGPGAGFSYSLETNGLTFGAASERAVNSALYDMLDDADTPDDTPGADDDAIGGLASQIWLVQRAMALFGEENVSAETFWDNWLQFNAALAEDVRAVFAEQKIDFSPDAQEPNGSPELAGRLVVGADWQENTFYREGPEPAGDVDWFKFDAIRNVYFRVEIDGRDGEIFGRPDPQMWLVDLEAGEVLAFSDDPYDAALNTQNAGDAQDMAETVPSILWQGTATKDFYVVVRHASERRNLGARHGTWKIRVQQLSAPPKPVLSQAAVQPMRPGQRYQMLLRGSDIAVGAEPAFDLPSLRTVETRWLSTDLLAATVELDPLTPTGTRFVRLRNPGSDVSLNDRPVNVSTAFQPPLIISEIDPNSPDLIEIRNIGTIPADLTGWQIRTLSPTFSPAYPFPDGFSLAPGATVVVSEAPGVDTATELFDNGNLIDWQWSPLGDADANLVDPQGRHADYVRVVRAPASPHQPPIGGMWAPPQLQEGGNEFSISRSEAGFVLRSAFGLSRTMPTIEAGPEARANATDAFEENETPRQAPILSRNVYLDGLAISPRPDVGEPDQDWFAFPLRAGDSLRFAATFRRASGPLRLDVFPPGEEETALPLARTSDPAGEALVLDAATTLARGGGLYRLRVAGASPSVANGYALSVFPPLPEELPAGLLAR